MFNQKESEAFHRINDSYGGLVTLIIHKHLEIVQSPIQLNLLNIASEDGSNPDKNSETSEKIFSDYKQLYIESLALIKFIVEGSNIGLVNNEIEALFQIYVENYRYPEHGQDLLYSFFMKRKINGQSILNYKNRRFLFENILCSNAKINHSQITLKAFH